MIETLSYYQTPMLTFFNCTNLDQVLSEVYQLAREKTLDGQTAEYIPELKHVSRSKLGICVQTNSTKTGIGDWNEAFSIQSISKLLLLALVLCRYGQSIWKKVDRKSSQFSFNSLAALEDNLGKPFNPFDNAGALTVASELLEKREPKAALAEFLTFVSELCRDEVVYISEKVALSEANSADTNRSIAHYLKSKGIISGDVDCILGTYFHLCATELTCAQLSSIGRHFAGLVDGSPIGRQNRHMLNALMTCCGLYNGSSEFAFQVGVPAKSGVGGGILAIVPGKASIAVWSPSLDQNGNSELGMYCIKEIVRRLNWSIFDCD